MKFLATGDLHLGHGVERWGPERLDDQAAVWRRILTMARDESVDAVLFAGDLFERRRPTPEEMLAAEWPLVEHREESGPRVIAIPGNHDLTTAEAGCGLDVLAAAGLIELYRTPAVPLVGDPGSGMAVATLPWTPISRLVATRNGGDRDALYQEAAALLHSTARGLREKIDGSAVLLGHWSMSGAVTPTGREAGLDFGVVLDATEIESQGWDAVILGHIHKPQLLGSEDSPGPMFYVSSPLCLNFGEATVEHGVWLFDTEHVPSSAEPVGYRFVPIESRPFVTIDADFTDHPPADLDADGQIGFFLAASDGIPDDAIVRVRYTATEEQARRIDQATLRQALLDAGAWRVTIRPEIVRESRARVQIETETLTELDALDLWITANGVNGGRAGALRELTARYLETLT